MTRLAYEMSFCFSCLVAVGFLALALLFPKAASANKPENTSSVPSHCLEESGFPKNRTEHKTVKNFRVVVTTEHANGP